MSWESGTIYFSFMNNENLKKHTLSLIMFCYRKKNLLEIQAFDSIMSPQSTTSCQQLGFSLIKEVCEGWRFFVHFPSCLYPLPQFPKIWYVVVWRMPYHPLSFLLCPSHFPTLQHDTNQYLPDDCTHVDCFLNTKTWVPQVGPSQVDSVQHYLDGRGCPINLKHAEILKILTLKYTCYKLLGNYDSGITHI